MQFENPNYIISNCYAPTQQYKNDQLKFIQLTRNYLCKFENENIIVAGDFNLYLNPKLDKSDSTYNIHDNRNKLKVFHFLKA